MTPDVVKDRVVAGYLVHLIGCALSGRRPDGLPAGCSWDDVLSRAQENSILGLVWHAMRWLNGIPDGVRKSCERFSDMIALHNVRYEAERATVCEALRARGLSVMLLKGANLVARYPDYSMREVGDNDVLYGFVGESLDKLLDKRSGCNRPLFAQMQETAYDTMNRLGYELVTRPNGTHIEFYKDPGLCFELHYALFSEELSFYRYYKDPWRLTCKKNHTKDAIQNNGQKMGMEFELPLRDEFVYLMAHAYKHARYRGIGLRSIADTIVMLNATDNETDCEYIDKQLSELSISDFANCLKDIAISVRDNKKLSNEQLDIIEHMMLCDTYGSEVESIHNRMQHYMSNGQAPFLAELRRFFSLKSVQDQMEFDAFRAHPILRPFFPVVRLTLWLARSLRNPVILRAKLNALSNMRKW